MLKKIFATLLLVSLPVVIAIGGYQQPSGKKVMLDVPLIKQQTKMWCWATSVQMIMTFMGKPITQCEQADIQLKKTDCCADSVPVYCIKGGWPQFYRYGFVSDSVDAPLSWDQLKGQIDDHQPVVFSWKWTLGGGHMMVATGYAEPNWVYVNNPFPPHGETGLPDGDHQVITYEEYISSQTHAHWRDYYNIHPKPEPEAQPPSPALTSSPRRQTEARAQIEVAEVTTQSASGDVAQRAEAFVPYDKAPEPVGGFAAIQKALKYPPKAQEAGWEGRATINVLVNKDGAVADTKILKSSGRAILDEAAIEAIKNTKWRPALQRENPVAVWVAIPVNFQVRR